MSRDRLSRRAILAGAASVGAFAGAEAHAARQGSDAHLVALGREWEGARALWGSTPQEAPPEAEWDGIAVREGKIYDAIMAVPAQGLEGLAVKARLAAVAADARDFTAAGAASAALSADDACNHASLCLAADTLRLAEAAAIGAGNASVQAFSADHRDADLLALEHPWRVSAARCRRADRHLDRAEKRLARTPRPDGQLWREGDEALLGIEPDQPHPRDPIERGPGYYNPKTLQALQLAGSLMDEIDRTPFAGRKPRAAAVARLREILDADASWRKDVQAAWERAGLEAAQSAVDVEHEHNKALRFKILALPARTMEGIAFKVRVGAWCFGDPSTRAEDELDAFVHAGDAAGETFAFAVLQDLIRLQRDPGAGVGDRHLPSAA